MTFFDWVTFSFFPKMSTFCAQNSISAHVHRFVLHKNRKSCTCTVLCCTKIENRARAQFCAAQKSKIVHVYNFVLHKNRKSCTCTRPNRKDRTEGRKITSPDDGHLTPGGWTTDQSLKAVFFKDALKNRYNVRDSFKKMTSR
jgi:hypothetical protein